MQEAELEALEGLLYQMEVAAEAARLMLTTLGANFRVFSIWLLRLADVSQVCRAGTLLPATDQLLLDLQVPHSRRFVISMCDPELFMIPKTATSYVSDVCTQCTSDLSTA